MGRIARPVGLLFLILLLVGGVGCSSEGPRRADLVVTEVDELLAWMKSHPGDVGVVISADGVELLAHNADQRFPLASTIKVLTLLAFAEQVAAGDLDGEELVATKNIDEFFLPSTDGGTHSQAKQEWGRAGEVTLDQVARAMIRFSSNAAADFMLSRVGGPQAVLATARRHGMTKQQSPVNTFDLFREWIAERRDQRQLASGFPAGTPREWAGLLDRVRRGEGMAPRAAKIMQRHLSWPLEIRGNDERFDAFASKGGSLPGVLTSASYIAAHGESPVAIALFLRDVPDELQGDLAESFADQQLVVGLAEDQSIRDRLAELLPGHSRSEAATFR